WAEPALAEGVLPTGGQIVAGQGSISQSGTAMTITQTTQKMIATWDGFSIGARNSVAFVQPDASATALNRVLGQDPSQILGTLTANGQVFLVNPNGIVFGAGARVDVGGLVASKPWPSATRTSWRGAMRSLARAWARSGRSRTKGIFPERGWRCWPP
ncbi:MAG: filamentous hemagglutinin, partial [bacterium]